jgi:hypothetical protein
MGILGFSNIGASIGSVVKGAVIERKLLTVAG